MPKRIAAILAVYLLLAGCASQEDARYKRDGEQYGITQGTFRGRWWSYYERGSSFAAGKYYDEAIRDFETALAGRNKDTWRARTYGLHFVEYFPNRELGVAYFQKGNLEEAERYLALSLGQMDTERAHYYLDEIKKARIANGSLKDESSPDIDTSITEPTVVAANDPSESSLPVKLARAALDAPRLMLASARYLMAADVVVKETASVPVEKPANLVTEPVIPINIGAKDDVGVVKVAVNGKQMPQRGSAQQLKFRDDIQVKEGSQTIQVVATDLANKKTTKAVPVTVDLTGPTIGVFSPIEPTVTPEGSVQLDGASVDKVGVSLVAVGDRRIAESPGTKKLPFNAQMPLGNGENVFVLASKDTGGNETRSAVKVFRGDPNSREAKLWLLKQKRADLFLFASNGTGDLDELLRIAQSEAAKKPVNEIRLKSPSIDKPYRHNRTLRISGEIVTNSAVQSLAINGEAVNEISGAPKESFNKRIAIDEAMTAAGKVDVSVVAVTTKGETLEKTFSVALAPIEVASPASRMPVAVLAFAGAGVDASVSDGLRAAVEGQLVAQKRFRLLDRGALQTALGDGGLSTALSDPEQAVGLGAKVPAQIFLVGDVYRHEAKGLEIKVRAVDNETGNLAATLDVFIDDKDNAALVQAKCVELASQLATLYPRVSGEILSVAGNEVEIDLGADDGVRPGAYVMLYKQAEAWTDPATGEVLEPGELQEIGRARIQSVSPSSVRAVTIERKEEGAPLEKGMPAITM